MVSCSSFSCVISPSIHFFLKICRLSPPLNWQLLIWVRCCQDPLPLIVGYTLVDTGMCISVPRKHDAALSMDLELSTTYDSLSMIALWVCPGGNH